MGAQHNLARLRVEDPRAAAAVVDALWAQLAREEPRMFAALWRRANRPSLRSTPSEPLIPVQWIDELPPLDVVPDAPPSVNLLLTSDQPAELGDVPVQATPRLVFEPSPTLADLLPSADSSMAS